MKKVFSHPLFYCVFAVLGLIGCGLQIWFVNTPPDAKGLLPVWHPATVLTLVLLAVTVVLALLSARHVQQPKYPVAIRALGGAMAGFFTAIAALRLLQQGSYFLAVLAVLATLSAAYVVWSRLHKKSAAYGVYAVFAVLFLFYLISRYRVWSSEPETARYAFKLLALVCMMLAFYQKAAILAHTCSYRAYHLWCSLSLVLSFTALPTTENPMLYLSAGIWLLLDPSPRPPKRVKPQAGGETS